MNTALTLLLAALGAACVVDRPTPRRAAGPGGHARRTLRVARLPWPGRRSLRIDGDRGLRLDAADSPGGRNEGGRVFGDASDPGYVCFASWLSGALDAASCAR